MEKGNSKSYYISDVEQHRIITICQRLKGSVSSTDVTNWLLNFKPNEIDMALKILEKTEYITENEIIDLSENNLSVILANNPTDKIVIHPVAEFGKSGTLMSYYIRKTPAYNNHKNRIVFFSHYDNFKYKLKDQKSDITIVFIDDFSGSGKQFNNYYKTYIKPQIKLNKSVKKIYFMTLFYQPKAESSIKRIMQR